MVLFVETPRKFITAKLSIRKPGSALVQIIYILLALMKIPAYGSKALDIISFANVVLLFRKVYYTLAIHATGPGYFAPPLSPPLSANGCEGLQMYCLALTN